MENYFLELNAINVNDKTEKKNGLTYLSWAYAWAEMKKRFPDSTYTIYENRDGMCYHTDGRTCWVKTGVTCCGVEHIEYLPVMDYRNQSIPADKVTSFDVNKAIQRSLTKAVARHGLGLYVYAGEDLPDSSGQNNPAGEVNNCMKPGFLVKRFRDGIHLGETLEDVWRVDIRYIKEYLASGNDPEMKDAIREMSAWVKANAG